MIRTRRRLLAQFALAAMLALAAASSAMAQSVIFPTVTPLHLAPVHIAGGFVDVNSGGLVTPDYDLTGGSAAFGFVPTGGTAEYGMPAINDAIASGLDGGLWDGANGINSQAAANDGTFSTGVGYLDNGLGGGPVYSTWKGYNLAGLPNGGNDQALIGWTYYGDADMNGVVDNQDFSLLAADFNQPVAPGTGWVNGDFDYSGFVDNQDFSLLAQNFGKVGLYTASGPIVPSAASAATAVPEPSTVLLLICAALAVPFSRLVRRRVSR